MVLSNLREKLLSFCELVYTDLEHINQLFTNKSCSWKVGSCFLLIILPISLIIFQFLILYLIPRELTESQFFLNFTYPTLNGMFFSNYIHNVWSIQHLLDNYIGYIIFIWISFSVYFILIPILKKHNRLHFDYPDSSFFLTAIIFLLAFPFAESGISIYFGRLMGYPGKWGFSGVVWAFTAYFFFLLVLIMYDIILDRFSKNIGSRTEPLGEKSRNTLETGIGLFLILTTSIVIILPLYVILLDIGNEKINFIGHFAGFTFGLIISILSAIICQTPKIKQRIGLGLILISILIFATSLWYFADRPISFI